MFRKKTSSRELHGFSNGVGGIGGRITRELPRGWHDFARTEQGGAGSTCLKRLSRGLEQFVAEAGT